MTEKPPFVLDENGNVNFAPEVKEAIKAKLYEYFDADFLHGNQLRKNEGILTSGDIITIKDGKQRRHYIAIGGRGMVEKDKRNRAQRRANMSKARKQK